MFFDKLMCIDHRDLIYVVTNDRKGKLWEDDDQPIQTMLHALDIVSNCHGSVDITVTPGSDLI